MKNEVMLIIKMESISNGNYLHLKSFLCTETQKSIMEYLLSISNVENIIFDSTKAKPLIYYNLVYTGTSNCETPNMLIDLGNQICNTLNIDFNLINSVYVNLYPENGYMCSHYDQKVSYGISISLGADCEFILDDKILTLSSGDIIISDFSKIFHGINNVKCKPDWWKLPGARCSIQLRSVEIKDTISENEFLNLIK